MKQFIFVAAMAAIIVAVGAYLDAQRAKFRCTDEVWEEVSDVWRECYAGSERCVLLGGYAMPGKNCNP